MLCLHADAVTLGFGFSFADLAAREGLVRLDRLFLDRLAARGRRPARAPAGGARRARRASPCRTRATLVVALAPHLDAFVAALFGIEAETLALARETHALDPIHACKRLFVQRQAVKKYPDPSGFDGAGAACGAGSAVRRAADRACLRRTCRRLGGGGRRRGARRRAALRRLGDADRGRPRGASRRHAVPRAASARLPASGSG